MSYLLLLERKLLINFYPRWKYLQILNSTILLKKETKFKWAEDQQDAFESLLAKKKLTQPDFNKVFILETDASNIGLGAALSQIFEEGQKPIAFASRTLSDAEKKYSITEKEMLGALWAMEHFHYYLYAREFILRTDHKALEALNTKGFLE
jgi:hypothetical protein